MSCCGYAFHSSCLLYTATFIPYDSKWYVRAALVVFSPPHDVFAGYALSWAQHDPGVQTQRYPVVCGGILFGKDYVLSLSDIQFVDDTAILKASYKKQRAMMTRSNIHRNKNYARITLKNSNRILTSGRIYMLRPLKFESIRITLTDFFIPENHPDESIGIKLVITENPIIPFFFSTYAFMIITLIGFIIITWRTEKDRGYQLAD